jgi:CBS domain-containing protein
MDRPISQVIETQALVALGPNIPVRQAAAVMADAHVGAVPIVENGKLLGMFSERDIMTRVVAHSLDTNATMIGQVMTETPVTVDVHLTMTRALHMMQEAGVRHMPVTENDRVIGMLSTRDAQPAELADFGETLPYKETVLESMR